MKYYVLLTGEGDGCDYTIACNKNYFELNATNIEDAKREVKEYLHENENPENKFDEVIIIECNKIIRKIIVAQEWTE